MALLSTIVGGTFEGDQGVQGTQGTRGLFDGQGAQGAQGVQGTQGITGTNAGFTYTFSTTTTSGDPGSGFFRFNSAVTGSITEMYISDLDSVGTDRSSAIITLDDTPGTDRARIYLPGPATGFTISVTITGAITDNGTWLTIPVSFTSGALPSNNENRNFIGVRNGIQGVQGLQGVQATQGTQGLQGLQGLQGTFGPPTTPENAKTSAYVLAAADNGTYISITTGGVSITTATAMTAGQNVMIYNNSASNQTITQGASVTLRYAGTALTGNRTLASFGLATVLCVGTNTYVITGSGLT